MSSTFEFRRRIKSINNTRQITKAMQMIASIKMQKAVKKIKDGRSYIQNAWNILAKITKISLPKNHILFSPSNDAKKNVIILVSSDKGLCGSYNIDVYKKFNDYLNKKYPQKNFSEMVDVIVVGRRGADFVKRNKLGNLVAEFANFENIASYNDIMPISKLSNELYLEKKYKEVIIIYSFFESSLKHTPVVEKILPISDEHIDMQNLWEKDENNIKNDYLFEPESQEIIEKILIQIIRTQLYGAILEANASEYASRMIAMKNATDNAKNLIDELSLLYNSIRQSSITAEIAEISNASEAMK